MRWLEVRRHSLTKKGHLRGHGSHLSAVGVRLARIAGAGLAPFTYVVTSAAPRAVETAIAMGYAVDEAVDLPSGYVPGVVVHHAQWSWAQPYLRYAELVQWCKPLQTTVDAHRELWARAIGSIPDGGAALFIGHGGAIEPALVACLPDADHAGWGGPLAHCEGARLGWRDGHVVDIAFRRHAGTDLGCAP